VILPSDERCREIVEELAGDPELTQWEADFIASNRTRTSFTTAQKEAIARMEEKYDV